MSTEEFLDYLTEVSGKKYAVYYDWTNPYLYRNATAEEINQEKKLEEFKKGTLHTNLVYKDEKNMEWLCIANFKEENDVVSIHSFKVKNQSLKQAD